VVISRRRIGGDSKGEADSIQLSLEGSELIAPGVTDGYVRFNVLSLDELVDIAESRLTRSLTEEECQEYLHTDACPVE
jgi:hypothetical protein